MQHPQHQGRDAGHGGVPQITVAQRAAQQSVHGLPTGSAAQVPQCLVDAREGTAVEWEQVGGRGRLPHHGAARLPDRDQARGSVGDVYPPTITFTERHAVTLGGKRVNMIHLGIAHADDSAVLHFPDERAVFSADVLQVRRLPGGVTPTIGSWIDALRIITELDFDHALTGHAQAGTKKDAADLLRYLEELAAGVA